jgi:hypothetical protein
VTDDDALLLLLLLLVQQQMACLTPPYASNVLLSSLRFRLSRFVCFSTMELIRMHIRVRMNQTLHATVQIMTAAPSILHFSIRKHGHTAFPYVPAEQNYLHQNRLET